MATDIFVRVLGVGHSQNTHLKPNLAEQLHSLICRPLTGLVTIIGDNNLLGVFSKNTRLLGCNRCAQRCNSIFKARRVQSDNVHITLTQDHGISGMIAGKIECKQMTALFEARRIRRVKVFRLGIIHDTSTKRHDISRCINDGKHHTVAEIVIRLARFLAFAAKKPFDEFLIGVSQPTHMIMQHTKAIGGKSKPEVLDRRTRKSSILGKVFHALASDSGIKQTFAEKLGGGQIHIINTSAWNFSRLCLLAILRDGNAHPRG